MKRPQLRAWGFIALVLASMAIHGLLQMYRAHGWNRDVPTYTHEGEENVYYTRRPHR